MLLLPSLMYVCMYGIPTAEKRETPGADINAADHDDLVLMPSGGDEFMATKPWLGAIIPPTPCPCLRLEELKWDLDTQLR